MQQPPNISRSKIGKGIRFSASGTELVIDGSGLGLYVGKNVSFHVGGGGVEIIIGDLFLIINYVIMSLYRL